ncbi:hypothetical protein K3718_21405 (plasmid) [Leisingera aquaemixtae]|uniref:Uncharacterized protein n=1 Tax=Leisingera aquaemixtae TaxID=1396826 RepID=A0ABY5WRA6_9RHOB|nr:hypothetical protein [Leisingera aquaemixtae]UWQ44052.1 hypothetical protein K3718_21405 [Leisingera aquaemixtae]
MALSSRYDGISSKRLRHAFALQEIENSPASDEEINLYRRMQRKGWPEKTQAKVMRRVVISKAARALRRAAGTG